MFKRFRIRYSDPIVDGNETEEQPEPVFFDQPVITVPETGLQSETTGNDETTNKKNYEYKSLPDGKTGPTPIGSLKNNYSLIFRSNNYSIGFQLKNVA